MKGNKIYTELWIFSAAVLVQLWSCSIVNINEDSTCYIKQDELLGALEYLIPILNISAQKLIKVNFNDPSVTNEC
ncbi:hypothetical protein H5410_022087 [Solanum commersonii]|uniref:Uncharacterized protein n=1 Tax=Solanum commersonii TaxID=4109 RepID=A0A9J5ZIR7_SOLCO|nr:hypothetical protein H5410_022087 [Solanum commersonii]